MKKESLTTKKPFEKKIIKKVKTISTPLVKKEPEHKKTRKKSSKRTK